MIRVALDEVVLFLVPFVLFAAVLLLTRRDLLHLDTWSRSAVWLVAAGLSLVIAVTVLSALLSEKHTGAYVPPHMENGRPVPGGFR